MGYIYDQTLKFDIVEETLLRYLLSDTKLELFSLMSFAGNSIIIFEILITQNSKKNLEASTHV